MNSKLTFLLLSFLVFVGSIKTQETEKPWLAEAKNHYEDFLYQQL